VIEPRLCRFRFVWSFCLVLSVVLPCVVLRCLVLSSGASEICHELTLDLSIVAASFVLLFMDSSRMVKDVKLKLTSEPEAYRVRVIIISKEERGKKKIEDTSKSFEYVLIFGMRTCNTYFGRDKDKTRTRQTRQNKTSQGARQDKTRQTKTYFGRTGTRQHLYIFGDR
jgi:hypothetical protein